VVVRLKSRVRGERARRYRATLYAAGSNRYNFKLFDSTGAVVSQKTVTNGMANLPAGIAGNATLVQYLYMKVIGTIGTAQAFSSGTAFANATRFKGGRG